MYPLHEKIAVINNNTNKNILTLSAKYLPKKTKTEPRKKYIKLIFLFMFIYTLFLFAPNKPLQLNQNQLLMMLLHDTPPNHYYTKTHYLSLLQ